MKNPFFFFLSREQHQKKKKIKKKHEKAFNYKVLLKVICCSTTKLWLSTEIPTQLHKPAKKCSKNHEDSSINQNKKVTV